MAHNHSDEEDFDGFSDYNNPEAYNHNSDGDSDPYSIGYHEPNPQTHPFDEEASEASFNSEDEHKDHTGFFDEEASEADSDLRSENAFGPDDTATLQTFPRFLQLPVELREMVWGAFCPDLSTKPRVYELAFLTTSCLQFGPHVTDQTAPLRTVLAVHRETRFLGHKFAPDLITLPGGLGVAPCDLQRDLIFVDEFLDHYSKVRIALQLLRNVAPNATNLGWNVQIGKQLPRTSALSAFPALKNIFIGVDITTVPTQALAWCVSEDNHEYRVTLQEDTGIGRVEEIDSVYIWPDPDKYGESGERGFGDNKFSALDFEEAAVASDIMRDYATFSWASYIEELRLELEEDRITPPPNSPRKSVWPFARFLFDESMERLEQMRAWQKPWDEWETDGGDSEIDLDGDEDELDSDDSLHGFLADSDDGTESGEDDDEDDDELDDEDGSGADQSSPQASSQPILIDLLDSSEGEEDATAPSPSAGPSRRAHNLGLLDSSEEETTTTTNHASGTSRRARARALPADPDDEDAEGDDSSAQPSRGAVRHKRSIVVSDSEDDSEDETARDGRPESSRAAARRRRARVSTELGEDGDDACVGDGRPESSRDGARRKRPIVLSESEDEDGDGAAPESSRAAARRKRPVVVSESEDEDESGGAGGSKSGDNTDDSSTEQDSSSDEDSSDDDEDSLPAPKMSLAKRLRMEAAADRARAARLLDVSASEDEGSDGHGRASDEDEEEASEDEGDEEVW